MYQQEPEQQPNSSTSLSFGHLTSTSAFFAISGLPHRSLHSITILILLTLNMLDTRLQRLKMLFTISPSTFTRVHKNVVGRCQIRCTIAQMRGGGLAEDEDDDNNSNAWNREDTNPPPTEAITASPPPINPAQGARPWKQASYSSGSAGHPPPTTPSPRKATLLDKSGNSGNRSLQASRASPSGTDTVSWTPKQRLVQALIYLETVH